MSAALACEAAEDGLRVLVIDAVGDGGLERVLEADPRGLEIETLRLTPERALSEYIEQHLRLPLSPNKLGPMAKLFDYVATAAPGVREVLILGKIGESARSEADVWDMVVVDAPATGHAVELLTAADTLSELIRVGPIVDQTRWIGDMIADPAATSVLAVTLAEELSVSECLSLVDRLRSEASVRISGVVVNRMPQLLNKKAIKQANRMSTERASLAAARSAVATEQLARITEQAAERVVTVPEATSALSPIFQVQTALRSWQ